MDLRARHTPRNGLIGGGSGRSCNRRVERRGSGFNLGCLWRRLVSGVCGREADPHRRGLVEEPVVAEFLVR